MFILGSVCGQPSAGRTLPSLHLAWGFQLERGDAHSCHPITPFLNVSLDHELSDGTSHIFSFNVTLESNRRSILLTDLGSRVCKQNTPSSLPSGRKSPGQEMGCWGLSGPAEYTSGSGACQTVRAVLHLSVRHSWRASSTVLTAMHYGHKHLTAHSPNPGVCGESPRNPWRSWYEDVSGVLARPGVEPRLPSSLPRTCWPALSRDCLLPLRKCSPAAG